MTISVHRNDDVINTNMNGKKNGLFFDDLNSADNQSQLSYGSFNPNLAVEKPDLIDQEEREESGIFALNQSTT